MRTLDGPWQSCHSAEAGPAVQDGLAAVVDADGLTHVFAPPDGRALASEAPAGRCGRLRHGLPTPAGPVSAISPAAAAAALRERSPPRC